MLTRRSFLRNAASGLLLPATMARAGIGAQSGVGQLGVPAAQASGSASQTSLLQYLDSIGGSNGVLSGQITDLFSQTECLDILTLPNGASNLAGAYIAGNPGYTPAILGVASAGPENGGSPTEETMSAPYNWVSIANNWKAQNGVVYIGDWPNNPAYTSNPTPSGSGDQGGNYTVCFPDIITSGNSVYTTWQNYLAALCTNISKLNPGSYLFRIFHEMNGDWYWWAYGGSGSYGAGAAPAGCTAAYFQELWQQTHEYVTANIPSNIKLLWWYCPNNYFNGPTSGYPGSAYVDVIGLDAYPPITGTGEGTDNYSYEALMTMQEAPFIYGETGASSSMPAANTVNNGTMATNCIASCPNLCGIAVSDQMWQLGEQLGVSSYFSQTKQLSAVPPYV